jgi:predicted permease
MKNLFNLIVLTIVVATVIYLKVKIGCLFILAYILAFGFIIVNVIKKINDRDFSNIGVILGYIAILLISIPIVVICLNHFKTARWIF